jgi:hypothetical protein
MGTWLHCQNRLGDGPIGQTLANKPSPPPCLRDERLDLPLGRFIVDEYPDVPRIDLSLREWFHDFLSPSSSAERISPPHHRLDRGLSDSRHGWGCLLVDASPTSLALPALALLSLHRERSRLSEWQVLDSAIDERGSPHLRFVSKSADCSRRSASARYF